MGMNTGLVYAFLLSAGLYGGATAAELVAPIPTFRESLDSGKARIADNLFGLQLSAFGDVHSDYNDAGSQTLRWGAFELNAALDTDYDVQAAMAIVRDSDRTRMTVGFLDYHTSGGPIAPRGRLWVEKGFHVQVGRFDVPFGSDWQFFASKDSVSISRPLSTEQVMEGGYNDAGVRMLGNNGSINFNIFALRGFNAGRLVGGRVGVTPFSDPFSLKTVQEPKTFELGLSYLYDANSGWNKNETAFAADTEFHHDAWTGRIEYLTRTRDPLLADGVTSLRGFHVTQEYVLPDAVSWRTTAFARYEQGVVRPAEINAGVEGDDRDSRIAAGFSTDPGNLRLVQWKLEFQHYLAATPSTRQMPGYGRQLFWFTQLVVLL